MTKEEIEFFENVNPESLSDEQFVRYLEALEFIKAKRRRVSVDVLEAEFGEKSNTLLYSDAYEFEEVNTEEFVETLFNRVSRIGYVDFVPFEEVQSYEYKLWVKQKREQERLGLREDGQVPPINYEGYRMWRYNPVVFCKEGKNVFHRLLLKDGGESVAFLENREFAILSPVTYVGITNSYRNARYLYAFAIDLDGVSVADVRTLLRGMVNNVFPVANMIVNSGHGVHVYYLLERPIAMFATRLDALNKLKAGLTKMMWRVSTLDNPQVQSVVQGFRVPGTLTKFGKPIRAFVNREAPLHSVEELNSFLRIYSLTDEELGIINEKKPYNPGRVTLEEAKKLWPEWYASRVIGKKRVGKKWKLNRGLYDWWLNILKDGSKVTVHHRYWCILTLVVYAVKCGIPKDEVLKDALSLVVSFDLKTETVDNPFLEEDVHDAMRAYDEEYCKWPVRVIETTTGIRIDRNKRNQRKRDEHVKLMTFVRDNLKYPNGNWREGNGRKKGKRVDAEGSRCAAKVREWQESHRGCWNKSLCARETGLTRPTVHKWWNQEYENLADNTVPEEQPQP